MTALYVALLIVGGILAVVELVRSRLTDLVAWAVLVVVVALLLQKATRSHLQEQRCTQLRKRVTRVEAQWREATM